jgi:predicted ATPase
MDIEKVTVFIGNQGSGKSSVAGKLKIQAEEL